MYYIMIINLLNSVIKLLKFFVVCYLFLVFFFFFFPRIDIFITEAILRIPFSATIYFDSNLILVFLKISLAIYSNF